MNMTSKVSVEAQGYNSSCSARKVRKLIAGAGVTTWRELITDRVMVRVQTAGDKYEDVWMEIPEFEAWVAGLQAMVESPEYQAIKLQQAVRDEA